MYGNPHVKIYNTAPGSANYPRRRRLGAKTSARMPDLRSGKRVRGGGESTPRRAEPCRRLNKHAPETARLLSRAERALRRADVVAAAAPPLPDVREQLAAEVAARKNAEQKVRVEVMARKSAEQKAHLEMMARMSAEQSAASSHASLNAERMSLNVERNQNRALQRSNDDLQQRLSTESCMRLNAERANDDLQRRLSTESSMRLNAERQLSAMEGFEFEDSYCGSGSWKPILDQNAVQSLRMLQRSETHRCSYTIGSNTYEATMQFNGEIRQRNIYFGTHRRVRKTGTQPWQATGAYPNVTQRWLSLAGSWNTEQAVRELFNRRCGHTLQVESVTAVCHGASLNAFISAGSLGSNADPVPTAYPYSQYQTDALLFHGTTEANAANIMAEGLQLRFAKGGVLGAGIYGAPNPQKATQYCLTSQHGRFMFLCRFNTTGSSHQQNYAGLAEYCVFEEAKVVVLWMLKVR